MSLPSPKTVLQRLGLRPKKSLGQHFLLHPHQAERVVAALHLDAADTVVEVGPGLGALTVLLAEHARKVVALEVDPALCAFLKQEVMAGNPRVEIRCQDVLTFDFMDLSREVGRPLAVAGNLPYQITSPLLFKLMAAKPALSRAVVMVQAEVGDRLLAHPPGKDYGIVTVLVQYHFILERLFSLGPGNFFPPPRVDSVVLRLTPREPRPAALDEALFTRVVKAAFAQRRKTLKNTLAAAADAIGLTPRDILGVLGELNIDPGRRAESLTVAQFVEISNRVRQEQLARQVVVRNNDIVGEGH